MAEAVMTDQKAIRTGAGFNRRAFIGAAAATAAAPMVARAAGTSVAPAAALDPSLPVDLDLNINDARKSLRIDPRTTLLDALREHAGLTGSKKGCDHGQCGACTVMIDGRRVLSCLTLALAAQGQQITTIEGLAKDGKLHPMQQAFVDHDAFQCGYCTPGQIISGVACVQEGHAGSDDDVREYMSGNICRCAAYPNIVAAVRQAASAMSDPQKG
jgi:xanthine dehydrogenase YagT iron-sulfur-binding subunit